MASIRIDNKGVLVFYSKESDFFEINVNDDDRITDDNLRLFSYDADLKKIVYLPDITPVDKTVRTVEYNWQAMTASIYLNDLYRHGPYVFDCTSAWTEQDCINAINSLEL